MRLTLYGIHCEIEGRRYLIKYFDLPYQLPLSKVFAEDASTLVESVILSNRLLVVHLSDVCQAKSSIAKQTHVTAKTSNLPLGTESTTMTKGMPTL